MAFSCSNNCNWDNYKKNDKDTSNDVDNRESQNPVSEKTLNSESDSEKSSASSKSEVVSFSSRKPLYRLDDIILNEAVREQIRILKSRIDNHHLLYEEWGLRKIDPQGTHISVSFYGPPGTGKTMCAEGLASELGIDLIEVSYAEIESKYVGETGKNIRAAFQSASKTGALLFFDEADAILGARMSNVTQAADHAVDVARAVMLKELDNFEGIVVFATNKFGKYDHAFLRRILQHIEVPLPDRETRERLWQHLVVPTIPGRENLLWSELADKSVDMSGGDIKNCVIIACSEAVMQPEKNITQEYCLKAVNQVQSSKAKHDNGDLNIPVRSVTSSDDESEKKKDLENEESTEKNE